jgi:hypothetical protein
MQGLDSRTPLARRFKVVVLLNIALAVILLAGCGQEDFNRRLESSLRSVKHSDLFAELEQQPTPIPNTTVRVRFPKVFLAADRMTPDSPDPDNIEPTIPPARLQPVLFQLPNVKLMCQGLARDERNVDVPYFCHMAVDPVPAEGDATPKLVDSILADLGAAPAAEGKKLAWKSLDVPTPEEGQTVPWKFLEVRATMPFNRLRTNANFDLPGVLRCYLHEADGQQVLFVWRVPDSVDNQLKSDSTALHMCGTIRTGN